VSDHLSQVMEKWNFLMNTIMTLQVPQKAGKLLNVWTSYQLLNKDPAPRSYLVKATKIRLQTVWRRKVYFQLTISISFQSPRNATITHWRGSRTGSKKISGNLTRRMHYSWGINKFLFFFLLDFFWRFNSQLTVKRPVFNLMDWAYISIPWMGIGSLLRLYWHSTTRMYGIQNRDHSVRVMQTSVRPLGFTVVVIDTNSFMQTLNLLNIVL
jgi:hypothetical protein